MTNKCAIHSRQNVFLLFCAFFLLFLPGCGGENASPGSRDNTPSVLQPKASGDVVYGNDTASLDASHMDQGYLMVKYSGDVDEVRLQITDEAGVVCTYHLATSGDYETFPLTAGDGTYQVNVYEAVSGNEYAQVFAQAVNATNVDPYLPFLYPNQYVEFSSESKAVDLGKKLAKSANDDLDVVENIYDYIIDHIKYDYDLAKNVDPGYLPDVDAVLEEEKGICFDYAVLTTTMLRSQRIPTRLVVGYAGTAYHAWISVYIDGVGWINDVIEFKGTDWVRMDPTYDANSGALDKYLGNGSDYHQMYLY